MRLSIFLTTVAAAAATAVWLDRNARANRAGAGARKGAKPEHIQQWEGEGGSLPESGAHFSPPVEPAIQPKGEAGAEHQNDHH